MIQHGSNRVVVDARDVHKHFGSLHVLKGVSLQVKRRRLW